MIQLMDLFLTQNYQITFLSTASISENSFDLSSKNQLVQNILLNGDSFVIKIIDVVVLCSYYRRTIGGSYE